MRRISEYGSTVNSYVYKMIRRQYTLSCDKCPPNRKENWKDNHPDKSWKSYRKTQYRHVRKFR